MQQLEPFLGPSRQRPLREDDLQLEPELELDVLPELPPLELPPPELDPPELPPELPPPELDPPELEPPLSDDPQATDAAATTTKAMNETERRSMESS